MNKTHASQKNVAPKSEDQSRRSCIFDTTDTNLEHPDSASIQRVNEEPSLGHSHKPTTSTKENREVGCGQSIEQTNRNRD